MTVTRDVTDQGAGHHVVPPRVPEPRLARELVRLAALAPSPYNTQPWSFSIEGDEIALHPDASRHLEVLDPARRQLYASLGCALENLTLAAAHYGYGADVDLFPEREPDSLRVRLLPDANAGEPELFRAIPRRQMTRGPYEPRPLPQAILRRLEEIAKRPDVGVRSFSTPYTLGPMAEIVGRADRILRRNRTMVSEWARWARFNPAEAERRRDGLTWEIMSHPALPGWLGKILLEGAAALGLGFESSARLIKRSSALVLFSAKIDSRRGWIEVGRSFERFALMAAALDVRVAPCNSPCQVDATRDELRRRFWLDEYPVMLVRIGYAEQGARSPRRPVGEVLRPDPPNGTELPPRRD